MTESEKFWISLLDQLDDPEVNPKVDPTGVGGETPAWVTKLGAEVMTMLMPRIQLRVGNRPTPENIGALIGNHLSLKDCLRPFTIADSPFKTAFEAVLRFAQTRLGGFDGVAAMEEMVERRPEAHAALVGVIGQVLERPEDERYRFFNAFTRGIRPEKVSSEPKVLTESEKKRMNTLAVYGVALANWRKLDVMNSSKEAYDFLVKLLSVDLVGHDPERIRRMFGRLGKRFAPPGRPAK